MSKTGATIVHGLSVDVEDWYHDYLVDPSMPRTARVEANTIALLEIFAMHDVSATFFFLGEVAEQHPRLVRQVAAAGHEIGSHGYRHFPVSRMVHSEVVADVDRSVRVIEDTIGRAVLGYRAPYFSISAGVTWPLDILKSRGLRYDASILPPHRPGPQAHRGLRQPYRHDNGLWEFPVAMLQPLPFWRQPLASGNGLRWVPPRLHRCWLKRFEDDIGAGVFYLHPWELDPGSPVAPRLSRCFLRVGRRHLPERLHNMLRERSFAPIATAFADQLSSLPETRAATR